MTIITGDAIPVFQLMALKGACKLEALGMKHSSGRSVLAHAKRLLGLKPRTPAADVIKALETKIAEATNALGADHAG